MKFLRTPFLTEHLWWLLLPLERTLNWTGRNHNPYLFLTYLNGFKIQKLNRSSENNVVTHNIQKAIPWVTTIIMIIVSNIEQCNTSHNSIFITVIHITKPKKMEKYRPLASLESMVAFISMLSSILESMEINGKKRNVINLKSHVKWIRIYTHGNISILLMVSLAWLAIMICFKKKI